MQWIDFQKKFSLSRLTPWLLLAPLWVLYSLSSRLRRTLYYFGILKGAKSDKFVISVGNLTVGGTGKSPMISYLLSVLASQELKAAVLTRGYKSKGDSATIKLLNQETKEKGAAYFGDEPWMLFQEHPTVPFYCGKNRVESSRQAAKQADVLLLDDGMQHLQLERSLNLVLIDATQGFGNGHLLPIGPLREPKSALQFADALIVTKMNLAKDQFCLAEVKTLGLQAPIFESKFVPAGIFDQTGKEIDAPAGSKVYLFSGIGNPKAFETIIQQLGFQIEGHYIMPDHAQFDQARILSLEELQKRQPSATFICTEKDAARLDGIVTIFKYSWLKMGVEMEPKFLPWLKDKFSQLE